MPLRAVPAAFATDWGQGALPLFSTVESGMFRQHGLDVSLTMSGNAANVMRDILDGSVLFGNLAAPALVRAVAQGSDVVFIAGGVNQHFLVGAPGVKDISELKGARFGGGQRGDLGDFLSEFTFREVLGERGQYVDVAGGRERIRALLDGRIKASPLSAPLAVEARFSGCPWLLDYATYGLNFAVGGIAARRSTLKSDPNLVDTFLAAYVEGTKYYKTHRDFGIEIHQKYSPVNRVIAEGTYDVGHSGFHDRPDPATQGLQRLIDLWKETSVLPTSFGLTDIVDSMPIQRVCG